MSKSLPTGPLPTGRQAVPTEGGAGRQMSNEPQSSKLDSETSSE
jgi:hypothetical protein